MLNIRISLPHTTMATIDLDKMFTDEIKPINVMTGNINSMNITNNSRRIVSEFSFMEELRMDDLYLPK